MMQQISNIKHENKIKDCLDKAPKGLTEMIHHVLENLSASIDDEDAAAELNQILGWIAAADRPLQLQEVKAVVQLKNEDGEENLILEEYLRTTYASLFSLAREDGMTTADLQSGSSPEATGDELVSTADGRDDVDHPTDFDYDPYTTTVAFCHASIGDYFRNSEHGKS